MLIDTILQRAKYWSSDPANPVTWRSSPPADLTALDVAASTRVDIETALSAIWNNGVGAGAKLLRDSTAVSPLRFAEISQLAAASVPSPDKWIAFNPNYAAQSYFFNDRGTLVEDSNVLILAHELSHFVRGTVDPNNSLPADDAMQNAATWQAKGGAVDEQNRVAVSLGMTTRIRASYGGALMSTDVRFSKFVTNVSYTDGNKVDIVRIGDQNNTIGNIQDHSARTDNSRDLIFGLSGDDTINGGGGNDWLYGGDGSDTIYGGTGSDRIWGDNRFGPTATGDDMLYGGGGNDTIHGGGGIDTISGGLGNDTLYGDDGNDVITGESGLDQLFGGAGDDKLNGGAGDDLLNGGDGSDVLQGELGNDTLFGEDGEDNLYGGVGDDRLDGGAGADFLKGYVGNDVLTGGGGSDELHSGAGDSNVLDGGADSDTLFFDDGGGGVAAGGTGNDLIDARFGSGGVQVEWHAGDGFDTLAASYDIDVGTLTPSNIGIVLGGTRSARGVASIEFVGQSINDFQLVWAASEISSETADGRTDYVYGGDLRVVDKATGTIGVDLGYVIGTSAYYSPTLSTGYLQFTDIPQLLFDDARFEDAPEGADNMTLVVTAAPDGALLI
jgi:Ca2+-binding RTX toxin-like protein